MTEESGSLLAQQARKALELLPSMWRALGLVREAAPGWTAVWLAMLIVQGLLPVATVYLTKFLVDGLVLVIEDGISQATLQPVVVTGLAMALVLLLTEILRSATTTVTTAQAQLVQDYVKSLVHEKAGAVDLIYFDSAEFYNRLHRARYDAASRPLSLLQNLGSLLQNSITLVAMAGVLLQYGLVLPVALVISSIPALIVVLNNRRQMHRWRMRNTEYERRGAYYDLLLTQRRSAPEIRIFGLAAEFKQAYRAVRARLRDEQIDLTRRQGVSELFAGVSGLLVMAVAMILMVWQAIQGQATLGDLALFYSAFSMGQGLMRTLLTHVGEIYANNLFLADLFALLDLEPQMAEPDDPQPAPALLSQGIALEDVRFHYPDASRPALDNFDLFIPAGKFVAIVGRNGAGKSTLVKMLCRQYDAQAGRITLDGIDITHIPQDELHEMITVLFQEPVKYNDTLAQNIAYGDQEIATAEAIRRAGAEAGVDAITAKLPDGYDTLLGRWFAGGTDLSVGEWQRVALARAFLRQAPIMILDEPTSAMDPWAEGEWLGRFRHFTAGRTSVLITHRFTTAMYADIIHVMDSGRIVESGTHEELVGAGGLYAVSWNARRQRSAVPG